jgi:hypothetical protein
MSVGSPAIANNTQIYECFCLEQIFFSFFLYTFRQYYFFYAYKKVLIFIFSINRTLFSRKKKYKMCIVTFFNCYIITLFFVIGKNKLIL